MKFILLTCTVLGLGTAPAPCWASPPPVGAPIQGGCQASYFLAEAPGEPSQEFTRFDLGCFVSGGSVVLVEDPTKDATDPRNWSDVLIFHQVGIPPISGIPSPIADLISDSVDPTTGEDRGITDGDLAAAGVPVSAQDLAQFPNTLYLQENPVSSENIYVASGFAGQIEYHIFSDPPEHPVPTRVGTWGSIKSTYR
jgi:hypothetical protein